MSFPGSTLLLVIRIAPSNGSSGYHTYSAYFPKWNQCSTHFEMIPALTGFWQSGDCSKQRASPLQTTSLYSLLLLLSAIRNAKSPLTPFKS